MVDWASGDDLQEPLAEGPSDARSTVFTFSEFEEARRWREQTIAGGWTDDDDDSKVLRVESTAIDEF